MKAIIMNGASFPVWARRHAARFARLFRIPMLLSVSRAWAVIAATVCPVAIAAAPPASGDTYVYRLLNGYNNEVRGEVRYRVETVDADRIAVSVATASPSAGLAYTEISTREGNWLRHRLVSHDQLVDYEFAPALPAYVFPLDPGKSWSVRVNAAIPTGQVRSVRVDGKVLGSERIRLPAGEFDTVKIRRLVYSGDADSFLWETRIIEFDWYAPALGRTVRSESKSEYVDVRSGRAGWLKLGDWNVFELVEARSARP